MLLQATCNARPSLANSVASAAAGEAMRRTTKTTEGSGASRMPAAGARNWLFELLCVRAVGDEARQMLTQARTQARCGEPSPWFASREGAPLCWKPTDMRLRPACFPTGGLLGPLLRSIAIALIADCWRRFRMCPPPRGEIPSCGQLIDPPASY
jgi:hypothetical protein